MVKILYGYSTDEAYEVGLAINEDEGFKIMNEDLKIKGIKPYYVRMFKSVNDNKVTVCDYGSHTQFYFIKEI